MAAIFVAYVKIIFKKIDGCHRDKSILTFLARRYDVTLVDTSAGISSSCTLREYASIKLDFLLKAAVIVLENAYGIVPSMR